MLNFNSAIDAILGNMDNEPVTIAVPVHEPEVSTEKDFETFKEFLIGYVQEHDELPSNHQTIQQIVNMNSLDDIEQILRNNHDYCDECFLKMYRKYAVGNDSGPICGCGGE